MQLEETKKTVGMVKASGTEMDLRFRGVAGDFSGKERSHRRVEYFSYKEIK
jgi:hypothetical protein